MQELRIKNNSTKLKVQINGIPKIELIPKEQLETIINVFANRIEKHLINKSKCKK